MNRMAFPLLSLLVLGSFARPSQAQIRPKALTATQANETVAQRDARMKWWRQARFGLFIHWDPVSLKGTEISISRSPNPYGPNPGGIPAAEYDQLYKQFNPTLFDAKAIVELAQSAGMKYVVFTTKHHDGFAMFDSSLTDYKITSPDSPYGKDVTRQLADACHAAGLHFCVYYSQPDLHHPAYGQDQVAYNKYFHGQVHELQTHYGQVDGVWFDGLGGTAAQWDAENLFTQMRADDPNVLINDRCGLPGDYYTPEQRIGAYDDQRDWETCMTIGDQWAYKPNDNYKTAAQCIQSLARCSGGDGNLLLNIGLRSDGTIDPTQADRLKAIAKWMDAYSLSITATRGGPYKPTSNYVSTRRGNSIFVHVFHWDGDSITLPPLPFPIIDSSTLGSGEVKVQQSKDGIKISLPPDQRDAADTVIVLQLNHSAMSLPLISPLTLKADFNASTVYADDPTYNAAQAFDADPSTRWATPNGTKTAWLQAELKTPTVIRGVEINEAYAGRVQKFEFQYQAPGSADWITLIQGTTLGANYRQNFTPVTAKAIRLNILDATEGPTITEVKLDSKN